MPDKLTAALKTATMPTIAPSTAWQSAQVLHTTTTNPTVLTAATITAQKEMLDTNSAQAFCLRWNNYQFNLISVFDQLLQNQEFVDVTLACDGSLIKAHKMVLSACSPYFQKIFADNPCKHPVIIMKDIRAHELKAIVEFMYKGEINVVQDQIGPLLRVAEMLKIRGLADVSEQPTKVTIPIVDAIPVTNLMANESIQSVYIKHHDIENCLNRRITEELATPLALITPPVEIEQPPQPKTPRKGARNATKRNVTPTNDDPEIIAHVQTKKQRAKLDAEKPIMLAKSRAANRKTKKIEKSTVTADIFDNHIKEETTFSEISTMYEENKVRLEVFLLNLFFSFLFALNISLRHFE